MKQVLTALEAQPGAILFIDEIHTLVGAGSASGGTMDAGNLLKPALASGALRCIGSTTFADVKQGFDRDRALSRRFQKIEVLEPSEGEAIDILKGLRGHYERHHGVRYTDEAIAAAVNLSARYLKDLHLPDKAIDVLDEAGAAMKLKVAPGPVGVPALAPVPLPAEGGAVATADAVVDQTAPDPAAPPAVVEVADIEAIVAKMARAPVQSVSSDDKTALKNLGDELTRVIFGQDDAIAEVTSAIRLSRSGLRAADKPIGNFLFAGPTGVGKTELAKQLARVLHVEFLRFDMSEYMEKHAVSRLIGAPPGLRRLRGGRAAHRRGAQGAACGAAARRDREGAPRPVQHPAAGDGPRHAHRHARAQGRLPPRDSDHDDQRRRARSLGPQARLRRIGRGQQGHGGARAGVRAGVPQPPRRHGALQAARRSLRSRGSSTSTWPNCRRWWRRAS